MTFGYNVLTNESDADIELRAVEIDDPVNVELVHALVTPTDMETIGVWAEWPPPYGEDDLMWSGREEAAGATIGPGEERGLVLGLEPTTADEVGRSSAIRVTYVDDRGREFVAVATTGILVASGRDTCADL
ncbi:hypothetical protein [Phytoactinopolyspora limicola]|uniref:hypothetical protein n=1 Tax=Phytoactinopolyspora limicola TaxID=2715536 RepID=UPI00140821A1|nr:hypothetical protein [Phytoactinopolyspora limicola]